MCDIVFITPNMTSKASGECIGTLQLATILREKGVNCDILQYFRFGDVRQFDAFLENCIRMIEERNPKIVSLYTRCDVYHIQLRIAQLVKEKWPHIYILCGGPQSDISAEETVRRIPWVDFVCCGEGENTIYPLVSSLIRGEPDLSIDGLVYLQGDQVIKNPRPAMIQDLDELPFLDYSLFPFREDETVTTERFPVDVGRGCPFGCTFCSTKTFWGRKFRLKSPERIVQEIEQLHKQYGRTRFGFSHDMFTFNRNKVKEVCALLKALDFPVEWGCSARLDCIDRELIDVMVDAGLQGMFVGIETGSPRMQKLINKNLKLDRALDIIGYMVEKGLNVSTSFIYGFPEETEEDLSQTIALIGQIMQLRSVKVQVHLCAFLMGTELSERYRDEMTPVQAYSDVTGELAVKECADLIKAHPNLFVHMLEYKTEFRTKLRFFRDFINVWHSELHPFYQYISETYPKDRMVDMYYDFVEANREALEHLSEIPREQSVDYLVAHDKMPDKFAGDENYDIIQDLYRFCRMEKSEAVRNGENVTDMFGFDPRQIGKASLQAYTRCVAVVNWFDGKRTTTIYPIENP